MRRRDFIKALAGSATAWPLAVRAQQGERVRRIGVLMPFAAKDPEAQERSVVFEQSLRQLGWTVSRDLQIDYRSPGGDPASIRRDAAELVALAPDVLLAVGSSTTGRVCEFGFVQSLARPGGNATGFTTYEYSMSGKWVELLKQIAPHVTRVAVLRDPTLAAGIGQFSAIQSVAQSFGIELTPFDVRDVGEIERSVSTFARSGNGGLIVTAGGVAFRRDLIIGLASRHKLPAVYPFRYYAVDGGLISYGPRYARSDAARRGLRRPHPQGREASRHAGAGSDQVRTGYQPQDREGARPHSAASAARPG